MTAYPFLCLFLYFFYTVYRSWGKH